MRVARIGAGADLDRLDAELHETVERRLERRVSEEDGEDADLHERLTQRFVRAARSMAASTR